MDSKAGASMVKKTVLHHQGLLVETDNNYKEVINKKKEKKARQSDSLRTPDFIEKLQRKVTEDPSKSAVKL